MQKHGGLCKKRKFVATAVLIELIDEDEEQRRKRGKARAWIRRVDENVFLTTLCAN